MQNNSASASIHTHNDFPLSRPPKDTTHRRASIYKSVWNRKREIKYGCEDSNKLEAVWDRRLRLIINTLTPRLAHFYLTLLERLHISKKTGRDDQTELSKDEAAELMNVSPDVIKDCTQKLRKLPKWVTIEAVYYVDQRSGERRQGSNRFTLHPINDLIDDQGEKPARLAVKLKGMGGKVAPHPGGKAAPPSGLTVERSILKQTVTLSCPPLVVNDQGAKATVAGVASQAAAAAKAPDKGDSSSEGTDSVLDKACLDFIKNRLRPNLLSIGFTDRPLKSILKDMKVCFQQKPDDAMTFIAFWTPLFHKLKSALWIQKKSFGLGWLFRPSADDADEANWVVLGQTQKWGEGTLPERAFDSGEKVLHKYYGRREEAIILHPPDDSWNRYVVVHPDHYQTESESEKSYTIGYQSILTAEQLKLEAQSRVVILEDVPVTVAATKRSLAAWTPEDDGVLARLLNEQE